MLVDPGRSAYDLNFGIFGFRVRVHPFFWLFTGLLNLQLLQSGFPETWFIWIAIVFVSILIHELGHAFAYRLFRCNAHIVLYAFGGLAISSYAPSNRIKRILISLAGPFAGFIVAGLLFASNKLTGWGEEHGLHVRFLYLNLFFVNFYWGIFNLFPIFPLDGGQISRELCEWRWHNRGTRISLQISLWAAIAVAVFSFVCVLESRTENYALLKALPSWFPHGTAYTGLLFVFLAYQSYLLLQRSGRGMYYEGPDDRLPWER